MVVRPATSPLILFLLHYPCQPSFVARNSRGGCKKREGVDPEKERFSHIHIFRTNIQMYKTKHALIQNCFSPFQSCITLNFQYRGTYSKDHSKYVHGGRPPAFFAKNTRGFRKKWNEVYREKKIFHTYKSFELIYICTRLNKL